MRRLIRTASETPYTATRPSGSYFLRVTNYCNDRADSERINYIGKINHTGKHVRRKRRGRRLVPNKAEAGP